MIPIAVVAHPLRQEEANTLANHVQADAVFWDHRSRGAGYNHLQAWRWLANTGAPYGVVLEDDVLPAPNFVNQLAAAILHAPSPFVSLYLGRGRPPQWQQRIAQVITQPVSYVTSRILLSAQGYAMKTELFEEAKYVSPNLLQGRAPIDEAITGWLQSNRRIVSYCRESLVDHRDGPSLIEDHGDGQPRNGATALVADDCDGGEDLPEIRKAWIAADLHTDWTKGHVAL